jgi:hypothetical protein
MTDPVSRPVELGFAEFVAKLVSDVFDAVVSAQVEQRDRIASLDRLLELDEDRFIEAMLAEETVRNGVLERLLVLFPIEGEAGHGITVGAAYKPGGPRTQEQPAVFEKTGLTLVQGVDFAQQKLTEAGVARIYRHLAAPFARARRDTAVSLLHEGMPKLRIDSGRVLAKLTFRSEVGADSSAGEAGTPAAAPEPASAARAAPTASAATAEKATPRLAGLQLPPSLAEAVRTAQPATVSAVSLNPVRNAAPARLLVKPASSSNPQDAQSTSEIYSEVEIHFKVIA